MTTTINVLLVFLGALVAAIATWGNTHDSGQTRGLRRLNARSWTVLMSVVLALLLGVAKEFLPDEYKNEQRQLLTQILSIHEADHKLLTARIEGGTVSRVGSSPDGKALVYERQTLVQQREQLIQAAQQELLGHGDIRPPRSRSPIS